MGDYGWWQPNVREFGGTIFSPRPPFHAHAHFLWERLRKVFTVLAGVPGLIPVVFVQLL